METGFVAVLPPFGAGHPLPDSTTVRGPGGAVQVLQQLTATKATVLVPGDADFDQLLLGEVADGERSGQEPWVGPAVERPWGHGEEHGAGKIKCHSEARKPAPHDHLLSVAAEAADARKEFGLVIHFARRHRFVVRAWI